MSDDREVPDGLDEKLDLIEAGAKAGGARPYLLDYIKHAKDNVFATLVNAPPTHPELLRVWGYAAGIAQMEKDLDETMREGAAAREALREAGSASAEEPQE